MPLSKKNEGPAVIIDYIPQPLEEDRVERVEDFVDSQTQNPNTAFEINAVVSDQIGLTESKEVNYKKKFDAEVFRYVQEIKDQAHKEAYEKGLAEGVSKAKEEALKEAKDSIEQRMTTMAEIIKEVSELKEKMYTNNQKEMVALCYYMTEIIVGQELKKDDAIIINIINDLLEKQKQEEGVTVHLSPKDYEFFRNHESSISSGIDKQKFNFEEDANLKDGDIIIQNPRGILDGRIESRLEKLRSILGEC